MAVCTQSGVRFAGISALDRKMSGSVIRLETNISGSTLFARSASAPRRLVRPIPKQADYDDCYKDATNAGRQGRTEGQRND